MAAPASAAVSALRMRRPRDTASNPARRISRSSAAVQPPVGPTRSRTRTGGPSGPGAEAVRTSLRGRPPCSLRKSRVSAPGSRRTSLSGRGGWTSVMRRALHCFAASRAILRQRSSLRSVLSPEALRDRALVTGMQSVQPSSSGFSRIVSSFFDSMRQAARASLARGLSGSSVPSTMTSVRSAATASTRAWQRRPRPSMSQISSPGRTLAARARWRCSSPSRTIRSAPSAMRGTKNWLAVTLLDRSLQDVLQLVDDGLVDRFDVLPAQPGQLGEQDLLLLGQVPRRPDEDLDEEIALAPPGNVLNALAFEADRLARLGPGRHLEDLVPLEGRD